MLLNKLKCTYYSYQIIILCNLFRKILITRKEYAKIKLKKFNNYNSNVILVIRYTNNFQICIKLC